MANIYLINEEEIKERTPIYDSLDPKRLKSHILEAQDIDLRYILPKTLYDEVFNQLTDYQTYKNGGGTDPIEDHVEPRILNLINEVKTMLIYATLYQGSYSLFTVISNEGLHTQHSTMTNVVSEDFVEKQTQKWKQKKQEYSNILINYIIDNIDVYPEYKNESCTSESKPVYRNAVYLGKNI